MNGARSTFKRKGYLLTALAAAVLLAASPGTASAQSIGFVGSSGSVLETASTAADALAQPLEIKVRVSGLLPVGDARRSVDGLGTVSLTASDAISIAHVTRANPRASIENIAAGGGAYTIFLASLFAATDEVTLVVSQSGTGAPDNNWHSEQVKLTLDAGGGVDVSPAVYTVTFNDINVAPVAKFDTPSFTLTEGSERAVALDIVEGRQGAGIPAAIDNRTAATDLVTVRVHNSSMVGLTCTPGKAVAIAPDTDEWEGDGSTLASTGLLRTVAATNIATLADTATETTTNSAGLTITACDDMTDFRDAQITLEILSRGLHETPAPGTNPVSGNVTVGPSLVVTISNDEAAPTLSFSPTDVTIDEGGSTSTRLIADGQLATKVGMVKLMVEGNAMVDLYHEDMMLEEMNGYVTVDLGSGNSARLTAMSTSDPDLMDGETKYKAWKLMEDSTDAAIGDDYWFRVDVRGSTAVPALPLIGQLLLALFLMAGGSRLYRRRQG